MSQEAKSNAAKPPSEYEVQPEPTIFEAAAHNEIPEDAWEYRMRKAKNDAVYNNLAYVPYSSTMPVSSSAPPKFMWTKKPQK